eukprot:1566497-Pleurochrysis_carterae.AAC.3
MQQSADSANWLRDHLALSEFATVNSSCTTYALAWSASIVFATHSSRAADSEGRTTCRHSVALLLGARSLRCSSQSARAFAARCLATWTDEGRQRARSATSHGRREGSARVSQRPVQRSHCEPRRAAAMEAAVAAAVAAAMEAAVLRKSSTSSLAAKQVAPPSTTPARDVSCKTKRRGGGDACVSSLQRAGVSESAPHCVPPRSVDAHFVADSPSVHSRCASARPACFETFLTVIGRHSVNWRGEETLQPASSLCEGTCASWAAFRRSYWNGRKWQLGGPGLGTTRILNFVTRARQDLNELVGIHPPTRRRRHCGQGRREKRQQQYGQATLRLAGACTGRPCGAEQPERALMRVRGRSVGAGALGRAESGGVHQLRAHGAEQGVRDGARAFARRVELCTKPMRRDVHQRHVSLEKAQIEGVDWLSNKITLGVWLEIRTKSN